MTRSISVRIVLGAIRFYQLTLSPWVGRECRYLPTCSTYTIEAVERFGVLCGCWLGLRRILRCHPLGGRGFDPVPEQFHWFGNSVGPQQPHNHH